MTDWYENYLTYEKMLADLKEWYDKYVRFCVVCCRFSFFDEDGICYDCQTLKNEQI